MIFLLFLPLFLVLFLCIGILLAWTIVLGVAKAAIVLYLMVWAVRMVKDLTT